MLTARTPLLAAATLALAAACDPADDFAQDGELSFRCNPVLSSCGVGSNTPYSGATSLSPLDTQGNLYKDIQVDAVVLFGTLVLDDFWADHGQLFGKAGRTTYSGDDFLNAEFQLTAWGSPISLVVSAVTAPPAGESFWLYLFTWDDGLGGTNPACLPTGTGDLRALVHDDLVIDGDTGDVWARPDTVYIACLRGAAGEVAYAPLNYGFRPFEIGIGAFEAAMRFLRADYCGEGKSWTEYGQPITYSDKWGIGGGVQLGHTDAVWGMNGALCIGDDLRAGNTYEDVECLGPKPPKCGGDDDAKTTYTTQGRIWSAIP